MLDRKIAPPFKRVANIAIPQAKRTCLDNGIPLYYIEAGKQPVVRLEFIFKAGAWYEDNKGASYFAAKMLSEGTQQKSSAQISYEVEKFGAYLELNPTLDYSIVTLECLSKHLNNLLPLLHEILRQPTFPEDELVTLKNIKGQQTRVQNEKSSFLASKKFREAIFGEAHPYGKDLSLEDIDKLTRDDVRSFYDQYYTLPFEVLISGLPNSGFIADINKIFGQTVLQKAAADPTYISHPISSPTIIEKEANLQSSIRVGKKLLTKDQPDYVKLLIVNEILGGYFGSRLMKNIREDKGYTYGISSALVPLRNDGYFIIGTDVNKENTRNTLQEIYKEIEVLQTTLISDDELNTVRSFMIGSFLSEINTPFALSDKFKGVHLYGLGYDFYDSYLQTVNNITSTEIRDLAQQYLQRDTFSEVIVGGI
jgi:zinc protease